MSTSKDVKGTGAKNGRYVETDEYAKAAARFVKALGRRVGDEMDIDALPLLDALARELDVILVDSARKLQAGRPAVEADDDQPGQAAIPGYSYAEIGEVLDVTQQTAHRRFGPKRTDPATLHARNVAHGHANAEARRVIREAIEAVEADLADSEV